MSKQQEDLQSVAEFTEKRKRAMTQKALEYTVESKQRNARSLEDKLCRITRSIEALDPKSCTGNMLRELVTATEEFDLIQFELEGLYKQDKYGVYEGQALLVSENTTLRQARELITKIKIAQKSDKSSETTSVRSHDSRRSHASRASTSSSVARLKAAAEAAGAKEQAEYERLIAEKENEVKQREAEEEKRRQQACAQHERDIAFMSPNKRVAVANARLKAIQESMLEREIDDPLELPNMDITDCQERTMAWVHSSTPEANDMLPSRVPHTPIDGHTHESPYTPKVRHTPEDGHTHESPHTPKDRHTPEDGHTHESPYTPQAGHTHKTLHPLGERLTPAEGYTPSGGHIPIVDSATKVIQKTPLPTVVPSELPKVDGEPPGAHYAFDYSNLPRSSSRQPVLFSTPREVYTGIPLETFATTNQQIVASLAKQSLPKCHPDVFNGDVAMFHSWKRSFKGMVKDADVAADQELNYLRSYTSGNPQQLVDNYRKRQGDNPTVTLAELWVKLERRFGNAAALTQALIDRLSTAAGFGEKDCARLQKLADLCADVDCQMTYLPGLACLNYPIAIRPIIEKLPASLRSKWDKEIVRYAERHNDAYPTFREFSSMIQNQARKKNHPNDSAGSPARSSCTQNRRLEDNKRRHSPQSGDEVKEALKTKMDPDSGKVPEKGPSEPAREKHALEPGKQEGVVYRIPCECGKVYIGETGRAMQDRIKEHDRDIRLAHTQTSAVLEHANETGHLPLWNQDKFNDRDPHRYTRRVKEAIQIRLHSNNINRDNGIEIPEAWMPTIRKHNSRSTIKWTPEGTSSSRNNEDRNRPITANQRA